MTAPKLPANTLTPHRTPREYCTHPRTVVARATACAIERDVRMCVHCGREVS